MAVELEKLAQYYQTKGNQPRANLYTALAAEERAIGGLETVQIIETPKTSLEAEWVKQANRLADLFAAELGFSKEEYMDKLPKFRSQPESYQGRFNIPLLVQTPVGKLILPRMCEIAGVISYLDSKKVKDWQKDPNKFKTPVTPYVTWLHDGSMNLGRKIMDVRIGLAADERGGTVYDGLALFVQNPDILKHHYLDLPGSEVSSDYAPCLNFWYGRPELDGDWVDGADPDCGSVVAGRNIVTR